ncbi:MAG: hypothetical protein WCS42_15500, partial [Verrucomicrobiota bacterium]
MIGVQAGFERADTHTRRDAFNNAAERAGVLRDFTPMFDSVRMLMNVERFQFSPRAEIMATNNKTYSTCILGNKEG